MAPTSFFYSVPVSNLCKPVFSPVFSFLSFSFTYQRARIYLLTMSRSVIPENTGGAGMRSPGAEPHQSPTTVYMADGQPVMPD